MTTPISIVCVCDNHYAVLLAALIKSIESNHRTAEPLVFYMVDDGISAARKRSIDSSINPHMTTIHWLPMDACIPSNFSLPTDNSSLPLNIYIRLFISYFIPADTERVIFMDVDMIVLADVSCLWHTSLNDHIIGAVQDQWLQVVSHWGAISNYRELALTADAPYFNAGLMVIDLPKWKAADIPRKILDCLQTNKEAVTFQDQYGLNVVLAGKWLQLNPRWNTFAYSEEPDPYLIHFTGRKPIYKSYRYNKHYQTLFLTYLKQTHWEDTRPISEFRRYQKKLKNKLSKTRVFQLLSFRK